MQMANKRVKRCSPSLVIKELKIKMTRYHFTPTVIIITKKTLTSVGEDVETLDSHRLLVRM